MDGNREAIWQDFGLEELARGARRGVAVDSDKSTMKKAGALMGGRRVTCLR